VNTRAVQPRDFILDPQLTTLQLTQLEIVRGGVLKRFREFRFKHLMALLKFGKIGHYGHSLSPYVR